MVKEKRILIYFIGWLLLGFIICFVGVNKIFALTTTEYEDITYLNDYTIYYVKADYASSPLQLQPTNEYQLEQVTGFIVNVDNYSFNAGVTYNIEISMPLNTLTNANRYTVTGDNNMTCSVTQIDNTNPNFPNFTFNCPNTTQSITLNIFNSNGNYIVNTGLFRWNYTFLRKQISTLDLGIIENQQSQIIDQNNQIIQGQDNIINNNKENTDDIIENNNQNTQDIINSNKETQEVIKDQFNDCRQSYNLYNVNSNSFSGYYYNADGSTISNGSWRSTTGYININPNTTYTISNGIGTSWSFYIITFDSSNNFLERIEFNTANYLSGYTFTTNSNVKYIKLQGNLSRITPDKIMLNEGSIAKNYEPYGEEICTNKIDETNDKLDNIGGALTDDSPTDMSGLGDSAGWLPAGPVDSILTLPLTLFTTLSDNLSNNTCTTVVLKLPFVNKNINLPCIKTLYDKIGITGTLFTTAGIIASCFILFNYLLSLYNWVDKTLTMRENTMPGYYDDNWGGGA